MYEFIKNIIDICQKYNFVSCGFNVNIINEEIVQALKKNNLFSTVYSMKNIEIEDAKKLWSIGVQSIFTDDPSKFNVF